LDFLKGELFQLERISLFSFAKINLCLYVLGKRKDGYHQIVSVMQAIDLADKLELFKLPSGIKIECNNPDIPCDKGNLAYLAADAFFKKCKIKGGVGIKLDKKIPIASGLGGGSSNAASVLKGLNQLYKTNLSEQELSSLGAKIGSDVPFFFSKGQALVKGRGEIVQNIDIFDKYWLVLVKPNFEISTSWAYKALKIGLTTKPIEINLKVCKEKLSFFSAISSWENHLEMVVFKEYPIIKNIKQTLINLGTAKASMSGSGPTVYGLLENKSLAEEVKAKIGKGDWQIYMTRPTPL
jgi:4-diphosphocytidyl-2-C-methyl-D-erythritol kinase